MDLLFLFDFMCIATDKEFIRYDRVQPSSALAEIGQPDALLDSSINNLYDSGLLLTQQIFKEQHGI